MSEPLAPRIGRIPHHGKGLCRGCRGTVPRGRRTWCSQACVTEALIRKGDPGVVRRELVKRDREVCSKCGLDAAQVSRVLRYLHGRQWRQPWRETPDEPSGREAYKDAERWLYRIASGGRFGGAYSHLWEADHVTPVIEGGGGCGLDGYRTLCLSCHASETAALAARRARKRREQRMSLLQENL